jgi:pimeloyl-ACP methyl ester carboxylesterase
LIYFHGAPGAPAEAAVFDAEAKARGLRVLALDRFAAPIGLQGEAYFEALAAQIKQVSQGEKLLLVGFSIGAFVALRTSPYLEGQVETLHLISAAAPLEDGDFLTAMAGQAVFRLARAAPTLFLLLSAWQALLARFAPRALFKLLFASAQASDKALANDAEFQALLEPVLRACFAGNLRGYVRDVCAYVQPWQCALAAVQVPVQLWHGEQDNWSPPAMASYLQHAVPQCKSVTMMERQSHYGCLLNAAPRICAMSSVSADSTKS